MRLKGLWGVLWFALSTWYKGAKWRSKARASLWTEVTALGWCRFGFYCQILAPVKVLPLGSAYSSIFKGLQPEMNAVIATDSKRVGKPRWFQFLSSVVRPCEVSVTWWARGLALSETFSVPGEAVSSSLCRQRQGHHGVRDAVRSHMEGTSQRGYLHLRAGR